MTAALKTENIPAGGIAGFVMTDEQIEQLEAEELREQYGTTGIAQFSTVGRKMANFGRYGDDTVAHVETGELIVPRALIDNNPELKESIFNHLRELGVQDPERYVVGESKNSLNPTTGLPEFFFKKIFKSLSKVVKGVGKALKKAAPLIIPMALNYFAPGLGAVYSGAIGAGIGTLVQGGSMKDAFKAALVGGATGALAAGVSGKGDFMSNIGTDITTGNASISSAFSGDFAPLQGSILPSVRDFDANPNNDFNANLSTEGTGTNEFVSKRAGQDLSFEGAGPRAVSTVADGAGKTPTMFDKTKDFMFGTDATSSDLMTQAGTFQTEAAAKGLKLSGSDALALAKDELNPNFIRKYGPSLALAGVAGAAGGMFDAPEDEPIEETYTGMDKYNENPDMYNIASLTPQYIQGDPSEASKYPYYIPQAAAQGGQIFPRRVGGIMPDEGIPNKDSVRAMLMPGEFVMTTDAVKGLGGGDMNKGINNMYGVMRNLEQRGRGAA